MNSNVEYTETYILENIETINNLSQIIINNKYTEEFMEEILEHLDLKNLVKNNFLSDDFLEGNIYPFMDDHEVPCLNILNWVEEQRKILESIKKLNINEKKEIIKKFNKIDQSLIDYVLSNN
jgi:hypothetical protein